MSTIPTSLTENQFDEHLRPYFTVANAGMKARFRCTKSSTTSCTGCTQAVSGSACRLTQSHTIQKKRNQLTRGLLSFSQVEPGWQPGKAVGSEHFDD